MLHRLDQVFEAANGTIVLAWSLKMASGIVNPELRVLLYFFRPGIQVEKHHTGNLLSLNTLKFSI